MPSRFVSILVALAALLGVAPTGAAAATTTVECGQVVAYTAPDPLAPADGSLTIGLLPSWTIAADATLSAAILANLAAVAGTGPSCLVVDVDAGGVITALDFASTGSITGPVVYDSSVPGEILADRLLIPTFITDLYPDLAALFVASRLAGTEATVIFDVDPTTGQFTGFEGFAHYCGAADLASNGDGLIGQARIPASVLDAAATAKLASADGGPGCADVDTTGTVDGSGNLSLTTHVKISLAAEASPPNTAASASGRSAAHVDDRSLWILLLGLGVFALVLRVRPSRRPLRAAGRTRRCSGRRGRC